MSAPNTLAHTVGFADLALSPYISPPWFFILFSFLLCILILPSSIYKTPLVASTRSSSAVPPLPLENLERDCKLVAALKKVSDLEAVIFRKRNHSKAEKAALAAAKTELSDLRRSPNNFFSLEAGGQPSSLLHFFLRPLFDSSTSA